MFAFGGEGLPQSLAKFFAQDFIAARFRGLAAKGVRLFFDFRNDVGDAA
jgi:hypothetical protein